jgi:hypothetical protein
MEVYIDLYRALVIEGPSAEFIKAGPVEFIGKSMLELNPFNGHYPDVKRVLEVKRAELGNSYLEGCKAILASLFHYTFEEIDTWDAETFFERVAKAEFVVNKPIEPQDPTPVVDKNKGAAPKAPPRPKRQLTPAQEMVMERKRASQ